MRLSCWPAFQQTVRTAGSTTTKVDVPSGAYRSLYAATLSDSRLGATTVKGHGRQGRRLSYDRSRSNGREGTGIGNARWYPAVWC